MSWSIIDLGAVDVLAHQRTHIGQRVEEHVRVELRPQQPQLGLDRQALRLGARRRFPGQGFPRREVVQRDAAHQHGEEDRDQADLLMSDHAHRLAQRHERELVSHEVAHGNRDQADQQPTQRGSEAVEPARTAAGATRTPSSSGRHIHGTPAGADRFRGRGRGRYSSVDARAQKATAAPMTGSAPLSLSGHGPAVGRLDKDMAGNGAGTGW